MACSSLTSVTIPSSVTSIGHGAFEDCGLSSIDVESGNSNYDSRDNCNAIIETATNTLIAGCMNTVIPNSVTSIRYGAFRFCYDLTSVTIPNSVTSIGYLAFDGCSSLTSVTIPSSVTSIGHDAFGGCSGLTSVTALMEEPFAINSNTFLSDTYNSATLYVPYGTKAKYEVTDGWKEFKTIVELPASAIISSYDVDGNGEVDKEDMNCLVKKILGQANDTDDENYSYDVNKDGNVDVEDLACLIFRFSGKSIGQMSLPKESEMNGKDLTITVDGDTISVDNDGCYDAKGSTIMATNNDGEIVYMNISSVEKSYNAAGADLNAKESAITLMLPLVPNIFVAFDDEHLPHLKEMIWDVDEVKQLAAAIDRSVAKYGYTDFGEISSEATAARNKISQLLHLDKLAERQAETASLARGQAMLRASRSTESPYIVNPYGFGGLEVEITNSKKKQFYTPQNISGYNCDVTAYNYNRFAYSSIVKGKYDAETNTYYIPDMGNDYEYYKNILKPQKVSTFMDTFTSFKYEDLERLGQFLEESADLLQGDIGFGDMHWSDMKKTVNFDIKEQDDAVVLLFPRGNDFMLGYNVLQLVVKPIIKATSKKASKIYDDDVFIPFICEKMVSDPNFALEVSSVMNNPDLSTSEIIERITGIGWNQFFKALDKLVWDKLDKGLKDALTDLIEESVRKTGSIEAASDWVLFKAHFKALSWIKKYGDILTGVLGTLFEKNAVYPIHWEANGQFVVEKSEVTIGEGECVNVRVLAGSNSYTCTSFDESVAIVKCKQNKFEITGVDAGQTTIKVKDNIAQKTIIITVNVTGIQTFALASSSVSVPVYEDRSVTIERGDGPFHIYGGDEKIAVAKMGGGNPIFFPGDKYAVVISGVSEGSTTFYVFNGATNQILPLMVKVTAETVTITDEPIVDLGLSVNWANCNVGASEPQEYGDYFAWGEVNSKDYFSPNNYQYYSNGNFVDIGSDISGTEYDAATRNMGNNWRMPTKAEYEELISRCEWKYVTYRRERGWKVTGPNGNSIFLPAAGYMLNDWNDDASIYGHYWSSNITDNHREVYTLYASKSNYKMAYGYMNRFEGRTVRAVTGEKKPEQTVTPSEAIDLGLPSGTLWASCNVGASSPEEYGDHFAWGETTPKGEYNWSTYKWMNAGQSSWSQINKYTYADGQTSACWYSNGTFVGDGLTELLPADDAATANWGSGWQMPTIGQYEELINREYTMTEWTTMNGVNGMKITSKSNGNSIFLPAAGYRYRTSLYDAGSDGLYWSRSLYTSYSDYARRLDFGSGGYNTNDGYRDNGRSVRPVRVQN